MKLVKYQGLHPECLEGFPEDCERAKKSSKALHLRPGRTMMLTDDEFAFIKAQRPDVAKSCVVLRENVKPPAAESAPESEVEKEEELDSSDSSDDSMDDSEGDDDESL